MSTAAAEELRALKRRNRLLEHENEILRRAAAFFARELPQNDVLVRPRRKTGDGIPAAVTCRMLGFSIQSLYEWRAKPVIDRDWGDAQLINAALAIHADDLAFGYSFISDELSEPGIMAGENRVQRPQAGPSATTRLLGSTRFWTHGYITWATPTRAPPLMLMPLPGPGSMPCVRSCRRVRWPSSPRCAGRSTAIPSSSRNGPSSGE